jgi:hypothetical protein
VNDRSPLSAWIIAAEAVTLTVSVAPPTSSVSAVSGMRSPVLTAMPLRVRVLKPVIETSMV